MTSQIGDRLSIAALESEVRSLVECEKFGDALDAIRYFVDSVINNQRSVGKVFASADLDKLCRYVAEVAANKIVIDSSGHVERSGTVILATELIKAGGHLELLKDIIRLKLFDAPISVLLTDCFARCDHDMITNFSTTYGVAIEVALGSSTDERLRCLLERLCDLAPNTLVLLTHHQDSLGIATASSNVADEVIFIHHADHHLSLGVTYKDFIHIDPHNIGFFHCKDELGIKNYYWPLIVNCDGLEPRSNSFLYEGNIVTCSSGRLEKFDASFYLYDYFKLIPRLLAVTSGRHIHIGNLTPDVEARLQHELAVAGVEAGRFIHISWVPSVARALIEYKVDLYMSSFPLGGGKATIEAMAAGVPLLMHQSYRSRFHGGVDIAYPEAWIWQIEAELVAIVSNMKENDLRQHSSLARYHYEKFHTDQALIDSTNFSNSQDNDAIPKLREYAEDSLQVFLDETAEINAMQNNNLSKIERFNSEWLIAVKDRDALSSENARLRLHLNSPKALARSLAKLLISRLSR